MGSKIQYCDGGTIIVLGVIEGLLGMKYTDIHSKERYIVYDADGHLNLFTSICKDQDTKYWRVNQ